MIAQFAFQIATPKPKKSINPTSEGVYALCVDFSVGSGGCSEPERRMAKVCAFFLS